MILVRRTLAVAFSACILPVAAHADTYNLNANLVDGGIISGTVTFTPVTVPCSPGTGCSTISGQEITADNFTVTDAGSTYTFNNTYPLSYTVGPVQYQPYSEYFVSTAGLAGPQFMIDIPGEIPFQGSPIGPLCSINNPCTNINPLGASSTPAISNFDINSAIINVKSGSITSQVAATPEPSSLILLGTSLIGAAGAARCRFFSR